MISDALVEEVHRSLQIQRRLKLVRGEIGLLLLNQIAQQGQRARQVAELFRILSLSQSLHPFRYDLTRPCGDERSHQVVGAQTWDR
jgi:hypothetical protein